MSKQLTEEELQEFKNYRFETTRLAAILGDLHYQKTLLEFELDNLKESIRENAKKQNELLRSLGQKYGDGTINPENGEIIPLESSQPASEE